MRKPMRWVSVRTKTIFSGPFASFQDVANIFSAHSLAPRPHASFCRGRNSMASEQQVPTQLTDSFEKRNTWLKDGNCVHQLLRIWLRQGLTLLFRSVRDSPFELVTIFLILHPKYWDSGIYHHAWQPTRSKFKRLKLFWGLKHRDPSFLFA